MGTQGPDGPLASIARKYVWSVPVTAALGFITSILESVGIGLLIPLISLILADDLPAGIPAPIRSLAEATDPYDPQTRILAIGGFIILLIVMKGLVQAANATLIANIEGRASNDVRNALSAKILTLDYPFFLANDSHRLVTIISGDSWYGSSVVKRNFGIITAATTLLVFCGMLVWLDARLFLIVLAGTLVIAGVLYLLERRMRKLSLVVTATNHSLAARMLAIVNAMRVIRVFGQQQREQERFEEASERVRESMNVSERATALVVPCMDVMISILFVVVLLAAQWLGMSIAAISAFLILLSRGQPYARAISEARLGIASVQGSVKEVEWLLGQPNRALPCTDDRPVPALDRPIRFEKVCYSYPNGSVALHDVSFVLEEGVPTALIGRSGSGKSTLVNLLCRLIEPDSGAIYLADERIDHFAPGPWREHIALAGQDIELVDGSVAQNIAYGCPGAEMTAIVEAARVAGADQFISALPDGYDTPVQLEGLSLSGGQRQRIALARALIRKPDLLILDEATNAVDAISESEIITLLGEHRLFRTALVISHRRSTLAACRNGIVMHEGRVREAGRLPELDYYRAM